MLSKFKIQFKNKGEIYLRVKARPNSAKTAVKEIMDDETLKIDIAAPPVKGKANRELIRYLSKEFNVEKEKVKIISGASEKTKLIKIIKTYE